ncbi:acyltransferase family protein [Novosphingobium olei]|uniref:Acyltransferase n=1 Tax=Novosphingobium olei TaxID=2728851 RepID=A0A7Y0BTF5_9SPHN|nr:acyltransferase [Novosphingobium olei]
MDRATTIPDAMDPALTVRRFRHSPALDGLRAVAIGIVFLGHAGLGRVLIPGGFGVTIFFFLSGYLITSLLRVEQASTGQVSLKGFYLRRVLRIVPPLWISIALFGIGSAAGLVPSALDPIAIFLQMFFGINYAEPFGHADGVPGMPLWSLAVEEHYYLLFPAVFIFLAHKMSIKKMALVFGLSCLVALALRMVHVFVYGDTYYTYYFSHTRFDSILFGAVLALWQNPALEKRAWTPKAWQYYGALILLALTIIPRNEAFRETIRYTLQGALLFVFFSGVLSRRDTIVRVLESAPFQIIGRYSYTIYLSHYFFIKMLHNLHPELGKLGSAVLAAGLTLAYSAAMYKFVEQPAGALRRKLNPAEAPPVSKLAT